MKLQPYSWHILFATSHHTALLHGHGEGFRPLATMFVGTWLVSKMFNGHATGTDLLEVPTSL